MVDAIVVGNVVVLVDVRVVVEEVVTFVVNILQLLQDFAQ